MSSRLTAVIFFIFTTLNFVNSQELFFKAQVISESSPNGVPDAQICLINNECVVGCELTDSIGWFVFDDFEGTPDQYTLIVINKIGKIVFETTLNHLVTGNCLPIIKINTEG